MTTKARRSSGSGASRGNDTTLALLSAGSCSLDDRKLLATQKTLLGRSNTTEIIEMKQNRSFAVLIFIVIAGLGAALAYARYSVGAISEAVGIGVGAFVLALAVSYAIQVADQWDRAVILRLGHFHALKGPGLFFIIPVVDAIPYWIDTRVITTGFTAEKTLTKDTVPVDVRSEERRVGKECR